MNKFDKLYESITTKLSDEEWLPVNTSKAWMKKNADWATGIADWKQPSGKKTPKFNWLHAAKLTNPKDGKGGYSFELEHTSRRGRSAEYETFDTYAELKAAVQKEFGVDIDSNWHGEK
jgi:hypothetical protein